MKNFDTYEFAGLLTPGAVLLIGLSLLYPQFGLFVQGKGVTVGEVGLFVITAYVTGHLVQAFSSLLEPVFEKVTGGRPTHCVQTGECSFLSREQMEAVKAQLPSKLGLPAPLDINIEKRAWEGVVRQIGSAVHAAGRCERIDIFSAQYSLFRGLSMALLIVVVLMLSKHGFSAPGIIIGLALSIIATLHRLHHFSILYAREVFVEFLMLPSPEARPESPPASVSASSST